MRRGMSDFVCTPKPVKSRSDINSALACKIMVCTVGSGLHEGASVDVQ